MKSTAERYQSQSAPKFNVRFPAGMREEIAALAEKNGRSMNAEIVFRLRDSMPRGFSGTSEDRSEYVASIEEELVAAIKGMSVDTQKALLLLLKK